MSFPRLGAGIVSALALLTAGAASAGPIYSWDWAYGDAGLVNHNGGQINWIQSTFDTNTQRLSWYGNFGNGTRVRTDGFTLALRSGGSPKYAASEVALLYLDTKGAATGPLAVPTLTAYGYNGLTYNTSHVDGHADTGTQAPDRIASSALSGDWAYDVSCVAHSDGTRTIGFDINLAEILGHTPLYSGAGPWTGAGYDDRLSLFMQTFSSLQTSYDSGYLSNWSSTGKGYLEVTNAETRPDVTDPVPEPASLALLALGAAALGAARLRRRRKA